MISTHKASALALAAVLLSAPLHGLAAQQDDPYTVLLRMVMLDKDKDGMVSKDEFMAMVGKAFDMHAKDKGITNAKMTQAQIDELARRFFGAR